MKYLLGIILLGYFKNVFHESAGDFLMQFFLKGILPFCSASGLLALWEIFKKKDGPGRWIWRHIAGLFNQKRKLRKSMEAINASIISGNDQLKSQINQIDKSQVRTEQKVNQVYAKAFLIDGRDIINLDFDERPIFKLQNGYMVYANPAYEQLMGCDYELLKGKGWVTKIVPKDRVLSCEADVARFIKDPYETKEWFTYVNYETGKKFKAFLVTKILWDQWNEVHELIGFITKTELSN